MKKIFLFGTLSLSLAAFAQQPPKLIAAGGYPMDLHVYNGKLYYQCSQNNNGNGEVWVYDKAVSVSANNPKMLIDMDSAITGTYPGFFTEYNGKLFFKNNNGLYRYDDSQPLSATNPLYIGLGGRGMTVMAGKLYYDKPTGLGSQTRWLGVYDDNQPLSGTNPKNVAGGPPNTILTLSNNFSKPYVFQNKLFYAATRSSATGEEVWVYNPALPGSTTNPYLLTEINTANGGSASPSDFIEYHGKLYFSADDGSGPELWVTTNGTSATLAQAIDPSAYGGIFRFKTIYHDTLFFAGHTNAYGSELWRFDGTNLPTVVADVDPGTGSSTPWYLMEYGDRLIFNAGVEIDDRELWCYDIHTPVSATNPFKIYDLFPGNGNGIILNAGNNWPVQYGNLLYFGGSTGELQYGLYAINLCQIHAAQPPVFSLGNDTTINMGDTLTLAGPGAMGTYYWSNNSSAPSLTFYGTANNEGDTQISLTVTDTNTCTFTDVLTISVLDTAVVDTTTEPTEPHLGITENEAEGLSVYPNPTNDRFTVSATQPIRGITITNVLGQVLYQSHPMLKDFTYKPEQEGIYFVTVTLERRTFMRSVLVIR